MPSYTVSKNGYISSTGSFTWADSNINVTLDPFNKPEHLYAWTGLLNNYITYHAWTRIIGTTAGAYTLSETPAYNDQLYFYDPDMGMQEWLPDNVLEEYDSSTTPPRIGISYDDGDPEYYYRDSTQDKTFNANPIKLYTWTLTSGASSLSDSDILTSVPDISRVQQTMDGAFYKYDTSLNKIVPVRATVTSANSTSITAYVWPSYTTTKTFYRNPNFNIVAPNSILYGWKNYSSSTDLYYNYTFELSEIYTDTPNPTLSSKFYTKAGIEIDPMDFFDIDADAPVHYCVYADSNNLTFNTTNIPSQTPSTDSWSFYRDSTKDILFTSTFYTNSTPVTTGMTLYDNTGKDTGLTISATETDGSFDVDTNRDRYIYKAYNDLSSGCKGYFVLSTTNNLSEATILNTKVLPSVKSTDLIDIISITPYDSGWYVVVDKNNVTTYIRENQIYGQCTLPLTLNKWNFTFSRYNLENYKDVYLYADKVNVDHDKDHSLWDSTSIPDLSGSGSILMVNFVDKLYFREIQAIDSHTIYYQTASYNSANNIINGTFISDNSYVQRTDPTVNIVSFKIFSSVVCLTGDTLVTMADRSTKRLDEVELGDKVLSINPDTGELVEDEVIFTDKNENKSHTEYDLWKFSNDYFVKTVHRHRFYNVEDNSFTYMDRWKIGDHTIDINGEMIELLSHENIKETVNHYKITTKNYHNYFANGMLTGSRLTKSFNYKDLKLKY